MKKSLAILATLTLAASASAHTSALPHNHHGSETSWLPAIAIVATLVAIAGLFVGLRRRSKRQD